MIYLDNAATTLHKPQSVGHAMRSALYELASPGRGSHSAAMRGAEVAFKTREAIARLFHHKEPEGIVFCMNATHALNIAVKDLAKAGDRTVISGYEHNSVLRPLNVLGASVEKASSELFNPAQAVLAFERALTPGTRLAVINHVSNVFGYILPVFEIAEICKFRGIPFIIDASQSAGCLDIDFDALGADYIAMPGHKGLYGPQGTGILLCGYNKKPDTLMEGGSGSDSRLPTMPAYLPDRLEAGTHNMPGIAGLYEGVNFILQKKPGNILRHQKKLLVALAAKLRAIDGVQVFASGSAEYQSGVLSFNIEGMNSESAAAKLSEMGIAVRAGYHCSPLAHETAGTLSSGTVRVSFSLFNTINDVACLASAVREVAQKREN
ncbi:MAG: aminotransferase class V-fold PLP-dependent enzyme [Clostridiales bacterium]|jgi:cysteine desulfurase family protein|nr:aminotransferase class V-fold PLP-dependent enzyme [Clostridiales bacterium]